MIKHSEAFELEHIVRRVFNCDRFGVMGIADADHLERCPFDAAIVVFAPLYKINNEIEEIEQFMDEFSCYFTFSDYQYSEEKVREYSDGLKNLVEKYC